MWDINEMPDPDAGQRILNVGGQVAYKKDIKLVPRKIKTYSTYDSRVVPHLSTK